MAVKSKRRQVGYVVISLVAVCWLTGWTDHLFEQSFDAFQWPPYANLIRQVYLVSRDQSPDVSVVNDVRGWPIAARPECVEKNDKEAATPLVYLVVKSSAKQPEHRIAVRDTWGANAVIQGVRYKTVFVVGRSASHDAATRAESEQYGDVLWVDMEDTYRNNTRKLLYSLWWSSEWRGRAGCRLPDYALFIDDDYMVHLPSLSSLVSPLLPSAHLYMGWRWDTTPFRFRLHKHSVSLSAYPYDRYPSYISAGAVLMSRRTMKEMYIGSQFLMMYPYDDVYAGMLAYFLHIPVTHNKAFAFWESSRERIKEEWSGVIAAHGYTPQSMRRAFEMLYG